MLKPLWTSPARGVAYSRHTLSRSYGVNLLSSLTRDHSSALEFSSRLPELVCGTSALLASYEDFLGSVGSTSPDCPKTFSPVASRGSENRDFPRLSPYMLGPASPFGCHMPVDLPFSVPPSVKRKPGGTGILTCFPSPTPFGLGLGLD